jgi:ubiquinone/menaquinone biosynthesis C-methylase UbiE
MPRENKKDEIIRTFYEEVFNKQFHSGGLQQLGQTWASKLLEKTFSNKHLMKVLEVGGGEGQHLKFVRTAPQISYISCDIREMNVDTSQLSLSSDLTKVLHFQREDVENLSFPDETFDRVLGTCVLHHLGNPLAALLEVRRVAKDGAEISFVLPTDPGLLNRLIKRVFTFKTLRKKSAVPPEVFYALDHQNHIHSIIDIFKYVFKDDSIRIRYVPFKVKSWNFNLLVTATATKKN